LKNPPLTFYPTCFQNTGHTKYCTNYWFVVEVTKRFLLKLTNRKLGNKFCHLTVLARINHHAQYMPAVHTTE